jgi:hypothetical protein
MCPTQLVGRSEMRKGMMIDSHSETQIRAEYGFA